MPAIVLLGVHDISNGAELWTTEKFGENGIAGRADTRGGVVVEEENNEQTQSPSKPEPFITLPFDEKVSFQSSDGLLKWIKDDKNKFNYFVIRNKSNPGDSSKDDEFSDDIKRMIKMYLDWYVVVENLADDINKLHIGIRTDKDGVQKLIKDELIPICMKFNASGLVPMQGSIGICAMAMSDIAHGKSQSSVPPHGIAWLYAMTVLRRQQVEQKIKNIEAKERILTDTKHIEMLRKDVEEAQAKVVEYKGELEEFQKSALKSAALKSPAIALDALEKAHRNTALGYFGLIAAIVSVWISFVIFCYYPSYVKPLLDKAKDAPLEAGAMILTSMVFTGIVLTVVIILLRLAVSRINFSIAAGERKAMAAAYRALLDENAIPKDQQLIFLQGIVGGNFPGYVDSNRIPTIQDSLGTAARNLSGGNARG